MAYILGIDTGGTYTDGVLINTENRTVESIAKSFTTREDLSIGIKKCLGRLNHDKVEKAVMLCLSTTLATNSVVEGRGGRVGLFLMGKQISEELPNALKVELKGELDIKGRQIVPIDTEQAYREVENMRGKVDAIAISGFASVRNPMHELIIKEIVQEKLGLPVVCAHELSQALGFYERTVTTVLNAGLIPCITELLKAVALSLLELGFGYIPIMVVKGDGSLMHRDFALNRPIETVLSGPAASIVGGMFLTGSKNAIILDMGGTTSDIARIKDGKVDINTEGAEVGGWRTRLRAADVHTFGIGGDSRIALDRMGNICVGPQRVMPLCVAGIYNKELSNELIQYEEMFSRELIKEQYAECYRILKLTDYTSLSEAEEKIVKILGNSVHSLFFIEEKCGTDAEKLGLNEMVKKGILQRCGLTPTDLLHADGTLELWDKNTSRVGVSIMAKRLGESFSGFLQEALNKTVYNIARACLCAILSGQKTGGSIEDKAEFLLANDVSDIIKISMEIIPPIIALGAPVKEWMPKVCKRIGAKLIIPEHAEVANAVGAAVGSVSIENKAIIRHDQYHKGYVVHAPWGVNSFESLEEAEKFAIDKIELYVEQKAIDAGGSEVKTTHNIKTVYTTKLGDAEKNIVEIQISAVAVGSPSWDK